MSISRAHAITKLYLAGTTVFPADKFRQELVIFPKSLDSEVTFDNGNGSISIPEDGHFSPAATPTSTFSVVTAGTFVVYIASADPDFLTNLPT